MPACETCVGSRLPVFVDSPRNLTRLASSELTIPQPAVWKIVRKRWLSKCHKMEILQHLKPDDYVKRASYILFRSNGKDPCRSWFSATFHLSGSLDDRSVQMWSFEIPHGTNDRDCQKWMCSVP
jgi:hypothetical protein